MRIDFTKHGSESTLLLWRGIWVIRSLCTLEK